MDDPLLTLSSCTTVVLPTPGFTLDFVFRKIRKEMQALNYLWSKNWVLQNMQKSFLEVLTWNNKQQRKYCEESYIPVAGQFVWDLEDCTACQVLNITLFTLNFPIDQRQISIEQNAN